MSELTSNLRRVLADMMAAKRVGTDVNSEGLTGEGATLLMEMRQLESKICQEALPAVSALGTKQEQVDEADATLKALRYEKARALRGIAECRRAVPAVGVEDLLDSEAADDHRAVLARLAAECHGRRSLCDSLGKEQARKRAREEGTASKKTLLRSVDSQLESVLTAAAAIQAHLPPLPKPATDAETAAQAALLPTSLYTLWSAASSYVCAWNAPVELAVHGDAAAARAACEQSTLLRQPSQSSDNDMKQVVNRPVPPQAPPIPPPRPRPISATIHLRDHPHRSRRPTRSRRSLFRS